MHKTSVVLEQITKGLEEECKDPDGKVNRETYQEKKTEMMTESFLRQRDLQMAIIGDWKEMNRKWELKQ